MTTFLDLYYNRYAEDYAINRQKCMQTASKLKEAILSNRKLIQSSAEYKLQDKIKNLKARFHLVSSIEDICNKIVSDSSELNFATIQLAVDPKHQRLAERVQIEFLIQNGINVQKIPSTGDGSRNFSAVGMVRQDKTRNKKKSASNYGSTIDTVLNDTINFFMKVTIGTGGLQSYQGGNALEHVKSVIDYIDAFPETNQRFVFLLDGDSKGDMANAISELENIAKPYNKHILFVGSSDKLVANKDILNIG